MSNENSDTEEEILVYAEFEESVNIDKYRNIHVLGIDTKNPVFQLDDTFFIGKFENPLGTYMFFAEDPSPQCLDPLFDKLPEKNLQYLCKTRKFVNLQHAYITPKEESEKKQNDHKETQDNDIQPIKFKNVPDALEFFKKEWSTKKEIKNDVY